MDVDGRQTFARLLEQPLNKLQVGGSREIPMKHRNWCVFEKGHRYLEWSRVGLWCPTRVDANAELRRLQRIFPALKFRVGRLD